MPAAGSYVGYRPYPADGYPVLGWVNNSNVYVAGKLTGLTMNCSLVCLQVLCCQLSGSAHAGSTCLVACWECQSTRAQNQTVLTVNLVSL